MILTKADLLLLGYREANCNEILNKIYGLQKYAFTNVSC